MNQLKQCVFWRFLQEEGPIYEYKSDELALIANADSENLFGVCRRSANNARSSKWEDHEWNPFLHGKPVQRFTHIFRYMRVFIQADWPLLGWHFLNFGSPAGMELQTYSSQFEYEWKIIISYNLQTYINDQRWQGP